MSRVTATCYECIDGRLVMAPPGSASSSFGRVSLARLLAPAAEAAGFYVYGQVNLTFGPQRWIQPDVTVLHTLPATDEEDRWVPARLCTMAVEFVFPGSRRQDFVDKPRRCAEGGVPFPIDLDPAELLPWVGGEPTEPLAGRAGKKVDSPGSRSRRVP
uniref:Putative restriction endonuclease domain-containing protein n=1 Tax=Micromonospora echinospora TaxID=1877 RepID=Q2MG43_MICEC|nr:hypothetical protein [Micromonospora echinospora]